MIRLHIALAVLAASTCFSQGGPPTITTGVDPPAIGTCNDQADVGNLYVRSADSNIIPVGVFRCTQIQARSFGSAAYSWQPIGYVLRSVLPAKCTVGDIAFKTSTTAGQNLYGCTAPNVWTLEAGGGGGGGLGQYIAPMSGTSVSIPASTHNLGINPAIVMCRDASGLVYEPGAVTVDISGNMVITSSSSMSGVCILQGSPTGTGQYVASLSGTVVSVPASTHGLGVNVTVPSCYDGSGNLFEPGSVVVDVSGNVTITSVSTMTGKCILQ